MYDSEYIINIFKKRVDILNIISLIKARIRKTENKEQKDLLINTYTPLSRKFDDMIEAENIKDMIEKTKGTEYHEILSRSLEDYEKTKSYLSFEINLLKHFKEFVTNNDLYHTLGPYPLFSYLIKKEFELRNIFILSKSIDANINKEKTKAMIL